MVEDFDPIGARTAAYLGTRGTAGRQRLTEMTLRQIERIGVDFDADAWVQAPDRTIRELAAEVLGEARPGWTVPLAA